MSSFPQIVVKHTNTRHGHTVGKKSSTYTVWVNMLGRCYNVNSKPYKNYGGRGIEVCKRWRHSFQNFIADMGEKPQGLSLDRVNNNGNYSRSNCRWTTAKHQANNRRSNHRVSIKGKALTISQWAEISGIQKATIRQRLKLGWSMKDAVFTKVETI